MADKLYTTLLESPLGELRVGATSKGLCMLEFDDPDRLDRHMSVFNGYEIVENNSSPLFDDLRSQLKEYFNKERKEFDLPLDLIGTDFQKSVWTELLNIKFGATRSYQEQSIALGDVKAIRAVANANGQNRISIVIPCHRVIGSNGSLTGYGGKLWRKKFLLELESDQQSLF